MALVLKDRVRDTTTTTGTGIITLAGAPPSGYQPFSAIGNGNTCYYTIVDRTTAAWETGLGTYASSGTTLTRTTVLESSNGGAAVSFAAGTKDVFVGLPGSVASNMLSLLALGTGISFPATQVPSADPNTLDDYEEGTWTPTVTAASGTITTLGAVNGTYTKVGRLVIATASIAITTNGTGAAAIYCSLPFQVGSLSSYGLGREANVSFASLQAIAQSGTSNALIVTYSNGYPGGNGTKIEFTVAYFV